MGRQLKCLKCHVAFCTVYRPNFNGVGFQSLATVGLAVHNSRLMSIAEELACSVIDLANVLEGDEDFANQLELSSRGGAKIVQNITEFVGEHSPGSRLRARRPGPDMIFSCDEARALYTGTFGM